MFFVFLGGLDLKKGAEKRERKERMEINLSQEERKEGEVDYLARQAVWGWFESFVAEEEKKGERWEEGRDVIRSGDLGLWIVF